MGYHKQKTLVRVGLGLQHVFNLQTKGLGGWDGFISENTKIEF